MKQCKKCGCLLNYDHESDICECCCDDFLDSYYEYYDDDVWYGEEYD